MTSAISFRVSSLLHEEAGESVSQVATELLRPPTRFHQPPHRWTEHASVPVGVPPDASGPRPDEHVSLRISNSIPEVLPELGEDERRDADGAPCYLRLRLRLK
jgi:hypothetical protein